ncbi:unnamed protein product [Miscanthus lutarioriparius]|uniref:Uncharacterized protein n=1 Tax=Miscanthus lutarioriparius TaxID=422564 RepID=A0A811REU1_9POAL|nr:unnamed protein product [Miscanthus lutarioriparius]
MAGRSSAGSRSGRARQSRGHDGTRCGECAHARWPKLEVATAAAMVVAGVQGSWRSRSGLRRAARTEAASRGTMAEQSHAQMLYGHGGSGEQEGGAKPRTGSSRCGERRASWGEEIEGGEAAHGSSSLAGRPRGMGASVRAVARQRRRRARRTRKDCEAAHAGCTAAGGSAGKVREGSVAPARDEEEARQSSALASARERKQTSRQSCERAEREQQHVGRPTSITSDSKVMRPYEQRADKQGRQGSRGAATGLDSNE